jgi:ribonuclease P protein component
MIFARHARKSSFAMRSTRLRFPKSTRLTRAGEFSRLKREGVSFHGKLFVLSVLKSAPDSATRVGFITSRRVGGAVERNRVRRRLREIVRASLGEMRAGAWLVLIARQAAARASHQALREEWQILARRSALFSSCG